MTTKERIHKVREAGHLASSIQQLNSLSESLKLLGLGYGEVSLRPDESRVIRDQLIESRTRELNELLAEVQGEVEDG